jgi:arabinofuranosyltransferase
MQSGSNTTEHSKKYPHKETAVIIYLLLAFYLLLVIRNAWISDDGIITFRVVENFLAGYGLGYNPHIRVQAFTHPLWMFLISLLYFMEGLLLPSVPNALFYITLFLSVLFSFLTVFFLLTRISKPGILPLMLAVLMLSLSNGFIDFSTSGLENPLTHFLLVVFLIAYLNERPNLLHLSFISSLIMLNRVDAFALAAPALAYAWWTSIQRKDDFVKIMVGLIPMVLWELSSLFYFGFLFPNTAYAKLNTGIPDTLLMLQGLDYLLNAINWDTVTIFAILLAGIALYFAPDKKYKFVFAGILLYLMYIVRIGGDFFSSRFLSAPLLLSVAVVSSQLTVRRHQMVGLGVVILLGVFSIRSPLWSSNMVVYLPEYPITDRNAIADQRMHYFGNDRKGQYNSLVENGFREYEWGSEFAGDRWRFTAFDDVYIAEALGKPGYKKGPNIYVIDYYALSDHLLARLPISEWEIGHFRRDLPDGYLETLQTGENKIADPDLSAYYEKLHFVVAGPLFDWGRMTEIWKFNTGQYDHLLESYTSQLSK